jgi:predicted HTH transcriptional regulator
VVTTMTTPGTSELELLLADLESELVERKESFRTVSDKVRETVSAFANDLPDHRQAAIVFIGGKDDGSLSPTNYYYKSRTSRLMATLFRLPR